MFKNDEIICNSSSLIFLRELVLTHLDLTDLNDQKIIVVARIGFRKKKDGYHYQEFIDRQSRKEQLGGLKSNSSLGGKARLQKYELLRVRALELKAQGLNTKEISLELCVSDRTIRN
jgi:hypothetical protein